MAEISNYHVSSSPHKVGNQSTRKIMLDVIIALLPCVICGVIFYGLYSLMLVAICVATCFISEQVYNKIRKKPITTDLSAIVTGIILGLNLPPRAEWYIPIIGGVFAIIVVKMLFGGIGKNFANPAATARVFLLLAYGSMGTQYIIADVNNMLLGDVSTSATFLSGGVAVLKDSFFGVQGYWGQVLQLLFGYVGGSIGETCAIAIIIGCVYLIIKRVIDWKIPVVYLVTSALMVLIFYQSASQILLQLFAGGLMFGAVFMATDYSTSPKWEYNRILYAVGLGVLTILIRRFGAYPEGVSLAILIMNLFVPMMDRYIMPVRFGQMTKKDKPSIPFFKYAMWALCAVGALSLVIATPIVAVNQAYGYKIVELTGEYDYVHTLAVRGKDGDFRFNVKGVAGIPYQTEDGEAIYEQPLEYNIYVDSDEFKVTKIDSITESSVGYVLDKTHFVGKTADEISGLTESDLKGDIETSATYTATQVKNMIIECYSALGELGYKTEDVAIGLVYKHVKSIKKDGFTGNYKVNATGVAAIPWGEGFYNVDLEYDFVINAADYKIQKITPIKQSTAGEQYTLKAQLFVNKSLNEILSISSDSFTGATYTHNEFVEMVKESYRALNDAGVGVTQVTTTGEYNYVKSVKTSEFFGGHIVNVQGKAVLADQGNYEQPLEYNVVIENDKVVYIGAIKQSTWGYPANTSIYINKSSTEINAIEGTELTGATYSNVELKSMVIEAFTAVANLGGGAQ